MTRPRKPAPCPVCGSTVAVPIVYGEPTEKTGHRAERGEVVLGGCCINLDGGDPTWSCKSCGARFGRAKAVLGVIEWNALVRTMLPQPVCIHEDMLIGGDPGEVVVRITETEIAVAAYRIVWAGGSHDPRVEPRGWKRFPLSAEPGDVAGAVVATRARRLATYKWCPECHGINPPEWMMGDAICQSCGERNHGVVF